jgi:hypothetical protein
MAGLLLALFVVALDELLARAAAPEPAIRVETVRFTRNFTVLFISKSPPRVAR